MTRQQPLNDDSSKKVLILAPKGKIQVVFCFSGTKISFSSRERFFNFLTIIKMNIISKETKECEKCGYYHGFIEEKFNGKVPVVCYCQLLSREASKFNPVIIGFPDGRLFWKPISDYKDENGESRHVPHFAMGSSIPSPKSKI